MIPALTDEERNENLRKAVAIRKRRAELRHALNMGEMSFKDLFDLCEGDDIAASRMTVKSAISAMPGYGQARTKQLMERIDIAECKRCGGLGKNQRAALIEWFDK